MRNHNSVKLVTLGGLALAASMLLTADLSGANAASVIDFEDLAEGAIVSSLSTGGGGISGDPVAGFVGVFGFDPILAGNRAMVYDSDCPPGGTPADCSGGDDDLGTPNEAFGGPGHSDDGSGASNDTALGKVLILSEDLDSSDPDDADNSGSQFEFDYSTFGSGTVFVSSLRALDIEGGEGGGTIRLYSDLGVTLLNEVSIPSTGDNGAITVFVDQSGVAFMEVDLNGSGAIDNIDIETDEQMPAFARITGGGWRVTGSGDEAVRASQGLTLHCDITLSNNLQINWRSGGSNKWHIDKVVDAAFCLDDPAITPEPPASPADTYIGLDVGKLNGQDGSVACFIFADHGEVSGDPDGADRALIRIWAVGFDPGITQDDLDDPGFDCLVSSSDPTTDVNTVLYVPMSDVNGNLQFHFDQPHGSNGH